MSHFPEITRRSFTISSALGVTTLLIGGDLVLRLPAPTGPHPVGLHRLYLVDRSRPDPWDPTIPVREVLATVLYPARTVRRHPLVPQLSAGVAKVFGQFAPVVHPGLPSQGVNWAGTLTRAHLDAPALPGRRPVLLFGPGGGEPAALSSGLAQDLASHGWVVVIIDHPGDAVAVEFPGLTQYRRDTVRRTALRGEPRADPAIFATMIDARIADTRFVLDQLHRLADGQNPDAAGRPLPQNLGRALDLRRVGGYGHSAGGTAATEVMFQDRRIGAAINLEGYLDRLSGSGSGTGTGSGAHRPLLLVATDGFADREGMARSWAALLACDDGYTRRRQLEHAAHWVFTDYAGMAPQLQAAGLTSAQSRIDLVGSMGPARSIPLVHRLVRSFFAEHLSGALPAGAVRS
jgi:dienelactone hydrolase